ncbi:hypothetical protein ACFOKI_06135 [Sphingomonas qilianensis]|uniref:Glycosyltransferase family 1 protein n=1 Tax=Sphingomonas qilianensis TaxID=1736690 RepID=A0ABU9XTR9_9SPHN
MSRLPTTDLYFYNACAHRIQRWWRAGPIHALGANSFQCGDAFILIRRDTDELMARALRWPGRLIYLIDDDVAGAAASADLPDDYRRRLAAFDRDYHRPMVARADHLLVASAALRAVFAGHPAITEIDPFWSLPLADTVHFLAPGVIELAHLGSGSHAGGLALLQPVLLRLLDSGRDLRFTFIAKAGVHPALDAHPRAQRIAPRSWPRYRHWLRRQRFHMGLYPLADTPFDRARSANKLIEHGIVGAVGVYPANWLPAQRIGDGAILAPDSPADWFDTLATRIDHPQLLVEPALVAGDQLPAINNLAMQRATWSTLLNIAM